MLFGGYIRLRTKGYNFACFIDKCRKNGISLYNIKRDENGYVFDKTIVLFYYVGVRLVPFFGIYGRDNNMN